MPKSKGIGYQDASKLSSSRIRKKSKDEETLKKKRTKRTESTIKRLKKAGLTDAEIKKILDKGAQ